MSPALDRGFFSSVMMIAFGTLEFHPHPQIDPSGRQIVGYSILLIENGFNPGVRGHVLYFHQVEDFQTEPG